MIVVVIIGLLAAMAIPAFQKVRQNSREAAVENDARQLASAAQQYMLENNVTTVSVSYTSTSGAITGALEEYVKQLGSGYTIPGTMGIDSTFTVGHSQLDGSSLTFTAEGQRLAE